MYRYICPTFTQMVPRATANFQRKGLNNKDKNPFTGKKWSCESQSSKITNKRLFPCSNTNKLIYFYSLNKHVSTRYPQITYPDNPQFLC